MDFTKSSFFKRAAEKLKNCAIVHGLSVFAEKLYKAVSKSAFAKLFTSYDSAERRFKHSCIGALVSQSGIASSEKARNARHRTAENLEQSPIVSFLKNSTAKLLGASMQSYGIFFFVFGLCSTIIYLVKKYSLPTADPQLEDLLAGAVMLPLAIACFFSKKSLSRCVYESKILGFLLFDVLNLNRRSLESGIRNQTVQNTGIAIILGAAYGLLSVVVHPFTLLLVSLIVVGSAIVIFSPESGVIFICLVLPFFSTMMLVYTVLLTLFSFFMKLLCGKRVFKTELADIPVILFAVLTFFGGAVSLSSTSINKMLVMVCFILIYFAAKNLIRSMSILGKCLKSIAFSSSLVSVIGIFENYFGSPSSVWLDTSAFSSIDGRVVSTFENPNVLAEFLVVAIPITLALAVIGKTAKEKFIYTAACALNVLCLVFTWSRGAWIGIILAGIVYLLLAGKAFLTAGIICTPLAALGLSFGKGNVLARLYSAFTLSDTSSVYRLNIWRGVLKMLGDIIPHGIGIGEQAFALVYPQYALRGIETAPHSHSLYLQITTELGICGIVIFAVMLFVFAQLGLSYVSSASIKQNKTLVLSVFCGLTAVLLAGVTDYVWYNYRLFLFFWLVAGIAVASVSVAKTASGESGDLFY